MPSHGLPPFGANITNIAMGEGLCGSSMFGGDRWSVGVNPMTAGKSLFLTKRLSDHFHSKFRVESIEKKNASVIFYVLELLSVYF